MRRRALLAGAALLLAAGALAIARFRSRDESALSAYGEARLVALEAQLAQARAPYRLILGDSQAERLYLPELCGAPVVNAGIGGARAAGVRRVAEALAPPVPAEAVVVMVGINDVQRRREPAEPARRAAFREDLRAILAAGARRAAAVYATPLPPLDPARAPAFDAREAASYSAIVAEECARAGCRLADIFPADARRSPDGVHLATEAMTGADGVAARLARAVCRP